MTTMKKIMNLGQISHCCSSLTEWLFKVFICRYHYWNATQPQSTLHLWIRWTRSPRSTDATTASKPKVVIAIWPWEVQSPRGKNSNEMAYTNESSSPFRTFLLLFACYWQWRLTNIVLRQQDWYWQDRQKLLTDCWKWAKYSIFWKRHFQNFKTLPKTFGSEQSYRSLQRKSSF
jgi:hypothetical protein